MTEILASGDDPNESASRYSLIRQGLRVGLGNPEGLAGTDITGRLGGGAGRLVRDGLGTFTASTSPGRGVARLFKLVRVGKGKRAQVKRVLISKRNGGRGSILRRAARAVGKPGVDPSLDRSLALARWLTPEIDLSTYQERVSRMTAAGAEVFLPQPGSLDITKAQARARIVAEIQAGEGAGRFLLRLGERAAKRQAQRLAELRGVRASATSIEEAASAAVAGVLSSVRRLDKAPARLWRGCGAVACQCLACESHTRLVRVLAMFAGRAAFKSLASWADVGTKGDNTAGVGAFHGRAFVEEFTSELQDQLGFEAWRADDHVWFESERAARWRVVRWVYSIGYRQFCATLAANKGAGVARKQARARCRVVGSVLFGAPLVEACAQAGFDSVAAWVRSCKGARLFESLRAARAASVATLPSVDVARGLSRAYAIDARDASRELTRFGGLGAWSDTLDTSTVRARGWRGASAARRVLARRAILRDLSESIAGARYWQARARRAVRDNLRAFDLVLSGIHTERYGSLRAVFGFVDKRGRERSRKVNSSLIGRARGKVAHKARPARTVTVQVGSRSLQCAPSAGAQAWAQGGDRGFVVVKARA